MRSDVIERKGNIIKVAAGIVRADVVIKDARYLNVYTGEILRGDIAIADGLIAGIGEYEGEEIYCPDGLVVPGFIDGHLHIESSMAPPEQFSEVAFKHGTTTAVCDPHEIANVAGEYGIRFMLHSADRARVDFKFMLPSCVPATKADENYKTLDLTSLKPFFAEKRVLGLAEVMDLNSVLGCETDMLAKICYAGSRGRVDGHAPGLTGKKLAAYVAAGITSDHECTSYDEALNKLRMGQFIMIRQGTSAHNLAALLPLIDRFPDRCLLVTDDLHAEDLVRDGHIDRIIRQAVAMGADPIKAITAATLTPAKYFGLNDRGAIAPGLRADLVVLSDDFNVKAVYGGNIPKRGKTDWNFGKFDCKIESCGPFVGEREIIRLVPGELLTEYAGTAEKPCKDKDVVRLFAAERHHGTGHKAWCFLNGYGIKNGAVAISIAHDSHNIIAAGYDDAIEKAVSKLIEMGGGIVVTDGERTLALPLEIGGLMSDIPISELARKLERLKKFAYELGVNKALDPFMSLSFLSLPVIPSIRLLPTGVVRS